MILACHSADDIQKLKSLALAIVRKSADKKIRALGNKGWLAPSLSKTIALQGRASSLTRLRAVPYIEPRLDLAYKTSGQVCMLCTHRDKSSMATSRLISVF